MQSEIPERNRRLGGPFIYVQKSYLRPTCSECSEQMTLMKIKLKCFLSKFSTLLAFFSPLFVGLIWFAVSYPGNMSPDSLDSWAQIQSGSYNNLHPVVYTLLVQILTLGGNLIWFLPLSQIIVFYAGFANMFNLWNPKLKVGIRNLVIALIFTFPFIGAMSQTIWKDVVFSSLIFLGFSILWSGSSKLKRTVAVILIGFGASSRHEGVFYLVLIFLVILTVSRVSRKIEVRRKYGKISALLLFSIGLSFCLNILVPIATKAVEKPSSMYVTSLLPDLGYINSIKPESLPRDIHVAMNRVSSGESLINSRKCESAGYMFFSSGFDANYANQISSQIPKMWFRMLLSEPKLVLYGHFCKSRAFLPPPISWGPSYIYWVPHGIQQPNDFDLQNRPLLSGLEKVKEWQYSWDLGKRENIFQWPGVFPLIMVLMILDFKRRKLDVEILFLLFLLSSTRLFTLGILAFQQDLRLALITHFCFISGVFVYILGILEAKKPSWINKRL
jgi:hypothetical protein